MIQVMLRGEPFNPQNAKQRIVQEGVVSWSQHALDELAKDEMTTVDAVNILKGGFVEFSEEVRGTWRYRVKTAPG